MKNLRYSIHITGLIPALGQFRFMYSGELAKLHILLHFIYLFCLLAFACMYLGSPIPWPTCRGQRTTFGHQFFHFTMQVLEIKLRSSEIGSKCLHTLRPLASH